MGVWGIGIFQNDTALDVKETYIMNLKLGKTGIETYRGIIEEYQSVLGDKDIELDLYFSLALVMYEYGRLNDDIRSKTLSLIDEGVDLTRWQPSELKKRMGIVNELKNKLLSTEMPTEKKVTVLRTKKSLMHANEIYEFKLDDEYLKDKYYYNYCVYILVDSITTYDLRCEGLGDEVPVVYFKVSKTRISKLEEVDELKPLVISTCCMNNYEMASTEERRRIMSDKGYSSFKKRLSRIGEYNFKRQDDAVGKWNGSQLIPCERLWTNEKIRIVSAWSQLIREIELIFDAFEDYKSIK